MKKALFAVVALALLASAAQAGEIKTHSWPCTLVPQEVTTVKVTMDVGYWVQVVQQDRVIKLSQTGIHNYSGSQKYNIKTNTCLDLSCSITKTGKVGGDYTCGISPNKIAKGNTEVTVSATLSNADLSGVDGGSKDVHVANVTISVVPSSCPI